MTTLQLLHQQLAPELNELNQRIRRQLTTSNGLMNSVVVSQLSSTGKQIRPLIVILCARLFGEVNENVMAAAAAVELLHNASLIHDDVVDESKVRRNHPTINSIWDNHIAVLVGDFYVSSAMQQALQTRDIRIIESLSILGKDLSLGEIDQIYNARSHSLTEEAYYNVINLKTASLFVACARMGCYAAGADDDSAARLARFAELLGLCFQIRDDIFDYFSDDVGKPTGNDLRECKITLPLLHTLLRDDLPDVGRMREIASQETLTDDEIAELIAFAVENGGINYAFDEMHRLRGEAAEILAGFPRTETTEQLMSIFDYIIDRDH